MSEPGRKVGSLRIVERLGEGGMGAVFVAFDEKLQRQVALKAIHGEQLDPQTRARLLYEARILSQLDHPNVCRIYDYVESAEGDYLVLELIRGRNLREVLRSGRVELKLAHPIAEGVVAALVAAHGKGIVHRDLKPENVMLSDEGATKVLDFGLARAVVESAETGEIAEPPVPTGVRAKTPSSSGYDTAPVWIPAGYQRTELGVVTGTVGTMSPEQARGEPATAASDLYSFGLLLQELFTGRPAYEPGLGRHLLLVKAAEADTLPPVGCDPELAALIQQLKSKAPEARPSAVEVAERLRRIRMKPARRRRRAALAAVVALALAAGFKYTSDLRRERQAALAAQTEAEQVADFLVDLFEVSDPGTARGQTITAREVLDAGALRLESELAAQPRVRARMMATIGNVYRRLGLYEQAQPQLEGALALRTGVAGAESLEVAESLHDLGVLAIEHGRYEAAKQSLDRSLAIRDELLGPDDLLVARSLAALVMLANAQGDFATAEPLALRALEIRRKILGDDHPEIADSLQMLGSVNAGLGRSEVAEGYYRQGLAIREKVLGADHLEVALSLEGVGVALARQGKFARAEPYHERSLAIFEKSLGPDHERVSLSLINLAVARSKLGRPAQAEPLFRRALAVREKIFGLDHLQLLSPLLGLAQACAELGKIDEADAFYQRGVHIAQVQWGADDLRTIQRIALLATFYYEQGDYAKAEERFEDAVAGCERRVAAAPDDEAEQVALANRLLSLGEVRRAAGELAQAKATWERSLGILEPLAAASDDLEILGSHATVLLCLERIEEARPWVEKVVARGWKQADFLALARKHGLVAATDK